MAYRTRPFHNGRVRRMSHEGYHDPDRHDSAAGWNADTLARNARRLELERIKNDPGETPFEVTSGLAATRAQKGSKPAARLFGPLWHEGEVALLAGPASIGKSVLAVQIADQIARQNHLRKRVGSSGSPPYKGNNILDESTLICHTSWYGNAENTSASGHLL